MNALRKKNGLELLGEEENGGKSGRGGKTKNVKTKGAAVLDHLKSKFESINQPMLDKKVHRCGCKERLEESHRRHDMSECTVFVAIKAESVSETAKAPQSHNNTPIFTRMKTPKARSLGFKDVKTHRYKRSTSDRCRLRLRWNKEPEKWARKKRLLCIEVSLTL